MKSFVIIPFDLRRDTSPERAIEILNMAKVFIPRRFYVCHAIEETNATPAEVSDIQKMIRQAIGGEYTLTGYLREHYDFELSDLYDGPEKSYQARYDLIDKMIAHLGSLA